jgi:hypothetical protein
MRGCKYFSGVKQLDGTEKTERVYCKAYPEGIPFEIAYGNDKHLKIRKDQTNDVTFEKED